MQTTFPRLRSDLIVSRQDGPSGVAYVIKEPSLGRFVRLKDPEYFIAQQLDGNTPLEEVRRRAETRLDASLGQATLEQFTTRLNNLGLLENHGANDTESRQS